MKPVTPPVIHVTEKRSPYSYLRRKFRRFKSARSACALARNIRRGGSAGASHRDGRGKSSASPPRAGHVREILQFKVKTMADIGRSRVEPKLRERHIETPIAVKLDSADIVLPVFDVAEKINIPFNGKETISQIPESITVQFDVEPDPRRNLSRIAKNWPDHQNQFVAWHVDGIDVIVLTDSGRRCRKVCRSCCRRVGKRHVTQNH